MRERPERLPRAVLQGGLALRPLRRLERFLARLGRFLPGTTGRLPLREKVTFKVNGARLPGETGESVSLFRGGDGADAGEGVRASGADAGPGGPAADAAGGEAAGAAVLRRPGLVVRPVHAEILLAGLPNARRVVVEGCGHVPGYSHPEVLAEVVRQFLTPPG